MEPTIEELYRRIMQRHALQSDLINELVQLHVEQSADIGAASELIGRDAKQRSRIMAYHCPRSPDCTDQEGHEGRCYDGGGNDIEPSTETEPCPPPEMAVCAPSTVPPTVDPSDVPSSHLGLAASEERGAPRCNTCMRTATTARGNCAACDEMELESLENGRQFASKSARAKNEYTAKEWGQSAHFLAYMKKAPFSTWTAEQQNAKRDEFAAAMPADLRMNRWGDRFSKFCGVAS